MFGRRIGLLAVLALTALPHLFFLGHPMVHDDLHAVVYNPAVNQGRFSGALVTDPHSFSPYGSMYRPLLMASYVANVRLGGLDPAGFRLFNLALHLLAVGMVYGLILLLPPLQRWAFWGALLFGLHPVHLEAVHYLACRSVLGATAFGLLSVGAALAAGRSEKAGRRWALLSVAAFVPALGFKETALMVPALAGLAEVCFFRPEKWRDYFSPRNPRRGFSIALVGMAAVALAYLVLRGQLGLDTLSMRTPARPVAVNLLTQTRGWVLYLRLLFWPAHLSLEHQLSVLTSVHDPAFLISAAGLGALGVAAWLVRRQSVVPAFALGWFALSLLPSSSVVPLNVLAAENRLYGAGLGGIALLLFLFDLALPPGRRRLSYAAPAFLAACFLLLTASRLPVWRSAYSIWRDAANKAPGIARVQVNYGIELSNRGRAAEAAAHFRRAAGLDPLDSRAYSNLGNALSELGDREGAIAAWQEAVRTDPSNAVALRNLAYLLVQTGQKAEARAALDQAARTAPERPDLLRDLGALYLAIGEKTAGERELKRSLALDPRQDDVRQALEQLAREKNSAQLTK